MRHVFTKIYAFAWLALAATAAHATTLPLNYAGRFTDNTGKPLSGSVTVRAEFFHAATGGTPLAVTLADIPATLVDGMFQVSLPLSDADFHVIFNGTDGAWIRITDVTHNKVYPRQAFSLVPYALKVPIDTEVLKYDTDGKLTLKVDLVPDRVLGTDLAGALTWIDLSGSGTGDMLSGTWDSNSNSKVDDADHALAADDATTLNGQAASYYTNAANIPETATRKWLSDTERTKLTGLTAGADMLKSTYDTNADGKVNSAVSADDATQLNGQAASYYNDAGNLTGTILDARIPAAIARDAELPTAASIATGFAADAVSGDKIDGGTISNFASTGIDDNADALAMTIDSSERVGIGTTTPNNGKLNVWGNSLSYGSANILMTLQDTNTAAAGSGAGLSFGSVVSGAGLKVSDMANIKGIKENGTDANYASALVFSTRANAALPTEAMRISSAGNVGIGTTNPQAALDVAGASGIRATQLCDETGANCKDLSVASSIGSVTSVGITQPAAGITTSGGPITTSGNISLALADDLAAVEGIGTTGIVRRTGANTWSTTTDNSTNWDTAYTDRNKWDGGATGLNAATAKTSLGLNIGSDVQAYDAGLQSIAGLTTLADKMLYTTASDTYTTTTLTAAGRALIDDADAATQRTTLGLGTMATQSAGAVAITGGTIAGATITTPTFSNDAIGGDKIDGGTISNFASTGIDDNAAATAVTIDATGKVGIGTAGPSVPLHVTRTGGGSQDMALYSVDGATNGDGARIYLSGNNTTTRSVFIEGRNIELGAANEHALIFGTSAPSSSPVERMRIDGDGNVGIGTTTPNYSLDVSSTSAIRFNTAATFASNTILRLYNPDTTDTNGHQVMFSTNTTGVGASTDLGLAGIRGINSVHDHATRQGELAFLTSNGGNPTERLRIDESGNVGIGTTSPQRPLQVGNYAALATDTADTNLSSNLYLSGVWKYLNTNPASVLNMAADGGYHLYTAPSGTAGTAATITERFTVLQGGNVGIGTTSPGTKLHVAGGAGTSDLALDRASADSAGSDMNFYKSRGAQGGKTIVASGDGLGSVMYRGYDGASNIIAASIVGGVDGTPGTNDMPGRLMFYTTPDGSASPTERMRISSSGTVGIGTNNPTQTLEVNGGTSNIPLLVYNSATGVNSYSAEFLNTANTTGSHGIIVKMGSNSAGGAVPMIIVRPDGTAIGSITQATATTVAFNTTSDQRLKQNIVDTTAGLDLLSQIKVRDYDYIADPEHTQQQGFIAQELYDVYPQAVTVGGIDALTAPWQVDYGKLTPLLVKSVQDLKAENDALKAELSTVKTLLCKLLPDEATCKQ